MDAWCSLWLWAPQHGTELPTSRVAHGRRSVAADRRAVGSGALFEDESGCLPDGASIDDVAATHPGSRRTRDIAATQGWFHWELEFAPVFPRGGFDLQVGNPPWVRLGGGRATRSAEQDPWFGVTDLIRGPRDSRAPRACWRRPRDAQCSPSIAENEALRHRCLGATTREPSWRGIKRTSTWCSSADRGGGGRPSRSDRADAPGRASRRSEGRYLASSHVSSVSRAHWHL